MSKKSTVSMVGIRQIQKSRDLALGAPQKDIAKYEKVISAYGNVAPAIVAAEDGMYRLIDGQARIEAYVRTGINDVPVIIAQTGGEAEVVKLSLLLSASREQGNPLGEGAIIEKLTKEHGLTLETLSKFIGRSKSWLSKRQTMARNLSAPLAEMILNGVVCTRTAEEIAKLPCDEQALFAANVARDKLNKDEVSRLVRAYRSVDSTIELCRAIIETPTYVLSSYPGGGRTRKMRAKATLRGQTIGMARYAFNTLENIGKLLVNLDGAELTASRGHMLKLRNMMMVISNLIYELFIGVSPGKQEVASND